MVDGDVTVSLGVRLPGWLKNRVDVVVAGEGVSLNSWVLGVLLRAVEGGEGFPVAPPARVSLPSSEEVLRGLLSGGVVLEPCGEVSPCGRVGVVELGGLGFCDPCRVRVF